MLKKALLTGALLMMVLMLSTTGVVLAQDDDGTTTTTTTSNVSIFVVICENQAVVNLSGTMQAGYDVYFQVYAGAGTTGEALSNLRQVPADGVYTFSEIVTYPEGQSIAFQGIGSAYISIAREGNSDSTIYETTVDDLQDGCSDPQNPIGVSNDTGGTGTITTADGTVVQSPGTNSSGTSNILSPFGGFLNPNYIPPPEAGDVVIGARDEFVEPRQETPGLIFAECNDYPVAVPGIVYDTDNVVVFWSWFASTEEQVQDHIDNVNYGVAYYQRVPLPNVVISPIQKIGSNYWVFYYSVLGSLRPGQYYLEITVDWDAPITDGYDNYGPDTDNPFLTSGCGFNVLPNLEGTDVQYNDWPYQQY